MEITSARDELFLPRYAERGTGKVTFHYLPKDPAKALAALRGLAKHSFDPGEDRASDGKWTNGAGDLGGARKAGDTHKLLEAIKEPDGGFSIHDHIGDGPTTGYMVSLNKNTERAYPVKTITHSQITGYMKDHAKELKDPDNFFGAWHNPEDDNVYLDISTNYKDRTQAMKAAKAADQIAIFDLSNFSSLATEARRRMPVLDMRRHYSAPVIPIYADAKQFPKSDFNSGDGEGHTCSRWNCNKPAHQYRSTGQGQMWACPEHAKEMKKD